MSENIAVAPEPGTMRIQRLRGIAALNLRELVAFRDLFMALAHRDVKLRYRQTMLGVVWVLAQPLLTAGAFSLVLGLIGNVKTGGPPLFIFLFASQVGWSAFGSTLSKTSGCLVQNSQLVSKVFFPRLILPLSTTVSTLLDMAVGVGLYLVLALCTGVAITPAILTLPFWILLAILFGTGFGLYAAALMVTYRDVQYVLPLATQVYMYGSAVLFSLSMIKDEFMRKLCVANPAVGLMEGFRWSLLGGEAPPAWMVGYSAAVILVVFVLGMFSFKHMERKFADVI